MNCQELKDETIRKLCNVLRMKKLPSTTNRKDLSGNPQVDVLLLDHMEDSDLISFCQTNKYVNNLCNNEYFWMKRLLIKYPVLETPEYVRLVYKPDNYTWKEYYLWLTSSLNSLNEDSLDFIYKHKRSDLVTLVVTGRLFNTPGINPESIKYLLNLPVFVKREYMDFFKKGVYEKTVKDSEGTEVSISYVTNNILGQVMKLESLFTLLMIYFIHNGLDMGMNDEIKEDLNLNDDDNMGSIMLKISVPLSDAFYNDLDNIGKALLNLYKTNPESLNLDVAGPFYRQMLTEITISAAMKENNMKREEVIKYMEQAPEFLIE